MPGRWLALIVVLALLPATELVEQGAHVAEHWLAGEPAEHDAHHDEHDPSDEHGCTQLVHVCGAHHGAGMTPTVTAPATFRAATGATAPIAPSDLHDLAGRAPPHRPPIA